MPCGSPKMGKQMMVAVKDVGTDSFGPPMAVPHAAIALRSFQQECSNVESMIAKHPADFELHLLAEFDDSDGSFVMCPGRLARASDFVKE